MSIRKRQWQSDGEIRTAWVVDYVDQNRQRRLKTFQRKEDAKAFETRARYEIEEGVHAADSRTTIEEVVHSWITHGVDEGLERSTIEQRKRHLRCHIAPLLGRVRLADLTTPRVNAYMDRLRDAGMSTAMRRKVLTSLSSALSFAQGRGLVAQNVTKGVKVRSDERHKAKGPLKAGRDFPTKQDLRALMDNTPEFWRPFIVTAIFSGMRASELRGLRWIDVDLANGIIHVTQRADEWNKMGPPKSAAGRREIPLTPLGLNTLKQWRVKRPESEYVFTTQNGCVISYTNFHKYVFQPLLRRTRLDYSFHSLRHAAASLFIELGWPPKRVQAVMGHSSITMTYDRYGHLFPQGDVSEDMKRLQAAVVAA